jgi:O-antigen/teichoic acid export membrane protein
MAADTIPSARVERILVFAGRALAVTGALLGAVPCYIVFHVFDNGDKVFDDPIWVKIALCLLQIVPLPIAWWVRRRGARTTAARAVLVAGMALAVAFEARVAWNAFPPRVASDLVVIALPVFLLLFLAVIVLLAWLTGRWISWRSRPSPSSSRCRAK